MNTNSHNGDTSQCPFLSGDQKKTAGRGTSNRDWWPNELKLNILRQNAPKSNPMGDEFDYAEAFNSVVFVPFLPSICKIKNIGKEIVS